MEVGEASGGRVVTTGEGEASGGDGRPATKRHKKKNKGGKRCWGGGKRVGKGWILVSG